MHTKIVGVVQTSVILHAVQNGIGKRENLLTLDEADTGLKVRLRVFCAS